MSENESNIEQQVEDHSASGTPMTPMLNYENSPTMPSEAAQGEDAGPDYQIFVPRDVPVDATFLGAFKDVAREAGLTEKAVSSLAAWYATEHRKAGRAAAQAEASMKAAEVQELRNLQSEWGPQFLVNQASARQTMEAILEPSEMKLFRRAGFTEDALFLRIFERVSRAMRGQPTTTHRKGPMQRTMSGTPLLDYSNSHSMPKGD